MYAHRNVDELFLWLVFYTFNLSTVNVRVFISKIF